MTLLLFFIRFSNRALLDELHSITFLFAYSYRGNTHIGYDKTNSSFSYDLYHIY